MYQKLEQQSHKNCYKKQSQMSSVMSKVKTEAAGRDVASVTLFICCTVHFSQF